MTDVEKALVANATRCFDLLHRTLLLWGALLLAYFLLPHGPESATIKLSFSEFQVPSTVAKVLLLSGVILLGFFAESLLQSVLGLATRLENSEVLITILTYPSIATLRSRGMRALFGLGLSYMQYSAALGYLSPANPFLWEYRFGVAFALCAPMIFFAATLRNWDVRFATSGS